MTASPDWLPTVGPDTAAEAICDGIQKLVDSGVIGVASGALTAEPTMLVVGGALGTLAKTEFIEYSRKADRRLTQFIEETDEDEHAYLTKLAKGACHFLPDGFGDAAINAARGNPDRLRDLMEEHYQGDGRTELDDTVRRMLRGDFENFSEELCEAFDTDDIYEAQALFLDFRDIVEAKQVQETLETVLGLEGQFSDFEDELEQTRKQLRSGFRRLLQRDLRDSGFVRVAPVEFDREIDEPEAAWRAGFDLVHVRGTRDAENAERTSFVAEREGIHDDSRTATEELLSALRAGEDRLVVGRAGSGKSTVCKSVACEWFDDPDTGTVFYRRSGSGQPFTKERGIPGSLIKAVRESDGHTLVVVEDAARTETEGVYEAMADLRYDSVSFLLDTRRGDLDRFEESGVSAALETDMQGKVEEVFEDLTRYPLDEQLVPAEIEGVFERFEAKTGREVQASPEQVHERLNRGGDIGQVLFVSYYLPVGGERPDGLLRDVTNKYRTIIGEADDNAHREDFLEFDKSLRQDVALTTALLVAAGIGNHPELIHSLGEKHGHDEAVHDDIDEIREALEGWFVYQTDDPDAEVPATTHELWATLYLREEAKRVEGDGDDGWDTGGPTRFNACVSALYTVAENESCRENLREGFDESLLLKAVGENPAAFGKQLALQIVELGNGWPILEPLYQFGTDNELSVPSVCDQEAVASIEQYKGHVCLERGQYVQAQVHYRESRTVSEELGDRQGVANSLGNLGLVARNQSAYDDARDYFEQSLEMHEELGDRQGVATSLNNLGLVAQSEDDYDDARDYFEQSLEMHEELGDRQGVANSLGNLGLVARNQSDYDDARDYHQQSLEIKEELGDRQGVANSLGNLGLIAQSESDYDDARDYFEQSLEIERELGNRQGVATGLNNLGLVAQSEGDYDDARDYFERANERLRNIGDLRGSVTTFENLVDICERMDDVGAAIEWCERAKAWAESIELIDLSDTVKEFELRRLQLDVSEETTALLYYHAVGHVCTNQGDWAVELFNELWSRKETFDTDDEIHEIIASAGVFLAAHERLLESDAVLPEAEEILTTVGEHQEKLTPGSAMLFERLTEEKIETTAEDLQKKAEEQESEMEQLDLLAAATILDALDRE